MKAPPKRKGNSPESVLHLQGKGYLNESPSEKEGKFLAAARLSRGHATSMKAPPKRKGNTVRWGKDAWAVVIHLNESPSEKEGK